MVYAGFSIDGTRIDLRQITSLLESEYRQDLMLEQHIEAELVSDPINDLIWCHRFSNIIQKWAPLDQHLIIVTSEGRVIGDIPNETYVICNFIGQSDNADQLKKKNMVESKY